MINISLNVTDEELMSYFVENILNQNEIIREVRLIPLGIGIMFFVLYLISHIYLGLMFKDYEKKFKKNQVTEKEYKKWKKIFRFYPLFFLLFILLVMSSRL